MPLLISTTYITLPLLLLTSYQPHYHTLPPLHVHLYLTYFLYILSPIQFSHMYNVHCTLPSRDFLTHITTIITSILFILKNVFTILIVLYFVNNTYTHLRTM